MAFGSNGDHVRPARYMATHGLASVGGVQAALKVLVSLDLVEQDEDKVWLVTDPVFEEWLQRMG